MQLDAEQTDRHETHYDRDFPFGPSMHVSQNTSWQVLKRHYFSQATTPVAIVTPRGEPLFVVPYLKYKGFLWRYPVVGGVMVFHPDGRIEDLSREEAEHRPEIVASGRIFPETLARRVQESYRFRHGIRNTFFTHRDQVQIDDVAGSGSTMPLMMAFRRDDGTERLKWVSAAEPYGRAYATKAIFLTDAITGATEVWQAPEHADLTGPSRAIQTVRSLPGVVWTNFDVVEPRPVFIQGRLQYMFSVVPANYTANTVSKTVFVDAATNKVVEVFNHASAAANADEAVRSYLQTGKRTAAAPPPASGGQDDDPVIAALEQQLKANRALMQQLQAQSERLEKLLEQLRAKQATGGAG